MVKKAFLFKLLISCALLLFGASSSQAKVTYVSLVPNVTEIIYALGLEENLVGVSSRCDYPKAAQNKEKIGSLYGINKEKIIKLKPTYAFALSATKPFVVELEGITKFVYFDFDSVDSILNSIRTIGEIFGIQDRAESLIEHIKKSIGQDNSGVRGKSVLYVIQSQPLITIGNKSYLTDVISLSGNYSVTHDVEGYYPSISREYAIKLRPDYVVVGPYADVAILEKFLKNTKFVEMTQYQNDVINRPGPRVGESVKFFGGLK